MNKSKVFKSGLLAGAATVALVCAASVFAVTADNYNNMYLSYFSQDNIKSLGDYLQSNHKEFQGAMAWEISNDLPITDKRSLLYTFNTDNNFDHKAMVLYWADWDAYLSSHALPSANAPLANFKNTFSTLSQSHTVRVLYSFLEAVPKNNPYTKAVGTVYFNDPWSDLSANSCTEGSITDFYATWNSKHTKNGLTCQNTTSLGNYDTFTKLPANIEKYISIGGFGHDATFEDLFDGKGGLNSTYENNFISSLQDLVKNGGLTGIDFDYENPAMTHDQAASYLKLLQDVHTKMPNTKLSMAVLADPDYLQGKRNGSHGFDNLSQFSSIVQSIDLMTYDFHGAFDFTPGGTNNTGFLSNIKTSDENAPQFAPKFSIDASMNAANQLGIPGSKLVVGVPLYARSLANINPGSDHTGMSQGLLSGQPLVMPAGDLDNKNCSHDAKSPSACTGEFSYQYLIKNMLGSDKPAFTTKTVYAEGGSTMYADQWAPAAAPNYNLQISNLGPKTGLKVKINNFTSDYLPPSTGDKIYNNDSNISISALEGKKGLTVKWVTYSGGPTGDCSQKLNLTANMHIMINADTGACDIKQLP